MNKQNSHYTEMQKRRRNGDGPLTYFPKTNGHKKYNVPVKKKKKLAYQYMSFFFFFLFVNTQYAELSSQAFFHVGIRRHFSNPAMVYNRMFKPTDKMETREQTRSSRPTRTLT